MRARLIRISQLLFGPPKITFTYSSLLFFSNIGSVLVQLVAVDVDVDVDCDANADSDSDSDSELMPPSGRASR